MNLLKPTIILLPHRDELFEKNNAGILIYQIKPVLRDWLLANVGPRAIRLNEVTSTNPWRDRPWQLNCTHAFFFYNKKDAMLFKLIFGGSI